MNTIIDQTNEIMLDIFSTICDEESCSLLGHFVSDMIKVNNKTNVYPCFIGFNETMIIHVGLNHLLEQESQQMIQKDDLKSVKVKRQFLSKLVILTLHMNDGSSFKLEIPHKLSFIPKQGEHLDQFIKLYDPK